MADIGLLFSSVQTLHISKTVSGPIFEGRGGIELEYMSRTCVEFELNKKKPNLSAMMS